jgi:signal peptidase I
MLTKEKAVHTGKTIGHYLPFVFAGIVLVFVVGLVWALTHGIREVSILSGSMQPLWARGELLFLAPEPASAVRVGQAIIYHPPAQYFNGEVVHRIISIRKIGGATYLAHTKGLANPVRDPWADYLSGTVYHVVGGLPYLGFVSILIHDPSLPKLIVIGIAVIVLVTTAIMAITRHFAKDTK